MAAFTAMAATVGLSIATSAVATATTVWSVPTQTSMAATTLSGSLSGVSCVDATDCTAVGQDNYHQPFYITESRGTWGKPTQLAATTGDASLSALSCPSSGNCTAVGEVGASGGAVEPIYATENGGVWGSITQLAGGPAPGSASFADLSGVSCVDANDCTVVGDTGAMGGNLPLYATETDGNWSGVESFPTNPNGGQLNEGDMTSVSCTNATNCTAVGNIAFGLTVPGYATETNGVWAVPTEIAGTPSGYGTFAGVSCSSATNCTAVGKDNNSQPIYASETGGTWGAPAEVADSPGDSGSLSAVSCADAADCNAVGSDGNGQPMYDIETASTWGVPTQLSLSTGVTVALAAVSCTAPTACTAVGADGNGKPIAAILTDGTWSIPTELSGASDTAGSLSSVSCVAIGDCTAVGGDSNSQPIYETETSGQWGTPTEVPSGPGSFTGVSCSSLGNCTAVGNDGDSPMSVSQTDGVWGTPQPFLVGQSGTSGSFTAVSCSSAGNCTAVGGDSNGQPTYDAETSGVWGAVTELTASGGGTFTGVSCSEPIDCSAIGNNGSEDPIFSTESAGYWGTPTVLPDSTSLNVNGVSCISAGNCTAVGVASGDGGQGSSIYITQTNGTWTGPTTLAAPGSTDFGALYGVTCIDSTDCTAVGESNSPEVGIGVPIDVTEAGGIWGSPTALSGTPAGTGRLDGVSCSDASDCTAVGFDGDNQPIYASSQGAVTPSISAVSPDTGPTSGGTTVTITGTGFVAGATVMIGQGNGPATGAIPATNVDVVSPTEISATTGGGAKAGTWSLFVTTPGGTSATNGGDNFSYTVAPAVPPVIPLGPTFGRHSHHHHGFWPRRGGQEW
jgi:hypothetical protein